MNMTSSNDNDRSMIKLEVEYHYLSQALERLKHRAPERSYLHQRLEWVEEELEAMREDIQELEMETVQFQYPALRDQLAQCNDYDGSSDTNSIDSDGAYFRKSPPLQHDHDGDDDMCCRPLLMCIISTTTGEVTAPTTSSSSKQGKICAWLSWGLKLTLLIAGILLVTCNIQRHPKLSATDNVDEDIALATQPAPSDEWEIDFSSLLSNLQPHEGPCASFSMHLVADRFGNETSWELISVTDSPSGMKDTPNAEIYLRKRMPRVTSSSSSSPPPPSPPPQTIVRLSGGPYRYQDVESDHERAIISKTCLPVGSYKFILYDVQRDGICCDYGRGEYGLNLSKGRVVRPLSSGTFLGETEVTYFQVTEEDIDILPNSESIEESSTPSTPTVLTNLPTAPDVNPLKSLVTALDVDMITGSGKSYGMLFDIEATTSVVIAGVELVLATTSPTHYEIWSKEGSWQDVDVDEPNYFEGFRKVSQGSIDGQGASEFCFIPLQDFHDIEIQGGGRHAFWVTLSDDQLAFINYDDEEGNVSRHEMERYVQVSSPELNVLYGAAVHASSLEHADPAIDFWYNAGFLGRIWYKEIFD